MSPYLYQNVVFPFFDLLRGRRNIERLKFLRASQFWPLAKIRSWQLEKLNALLLEARDQSPFHRDRLADAKLPLKNLEELQTLPILTKRDIQRNKDSILCGNVPASRLERARTGGSTAEPTHFYYDKSGMDWNRGTVYRSQEWSGTFLGERTVQMMGSHYDYNERQKAFMKFMLWLQRYKDLPVAFMNDELFEKYVSEIQRYRPTSIWGYSSAIHNLACFVEKNHTNARFDFLKALITSSETLFPHQREKINQIFGAGKVYDHYGSREMYMASECREHHGYHIHAETIILEIVRKDGTPAAPGEIGRILLTDLFNRAFPFIRYEVGDAGVMAVEDEPCPCGVSLPKLARVEGRITDLLVLKDRILTSPNFTLLFTDYEGIDAYQFVQKKIDEVEVKIVRNSKFTAEVEAYLKNSLSHLMGSQTRFWLSYPDTIEIPKSGKRRYIISEVPETSHEASGA